jgi:hypothetical protein
MLKKCFYLCFVFTVAFSLNSCSVFQSKKSKSKQVQSQKKDKKNGVKPYSKVVTKDAKTNTGLFDVHFVDDKYLFEIPDSLFNRVEVIT